MSINILLVDDEKVVLSRFQESLPPHTDNLFNVLYAQNSDDAFKIMNQENIHIFIIDFVIKNSKNGDEIIKEISTNDFYKVKFRNSSIILMTGTLKTLRQEFNLDMFTHKIDFTHDKRNGFNLLTGFIMSICKEKKLVDDGLFDKHDKSDPVYDFKDQEWYTKKLPTFIDKTYSEIIDNFNIDSVVLVVNKNEFHAAVKILESLTPNGGIYRIKEEKKIYYFGKMGTANIILTTCKMGSTAPGASMQVSRTSIEKWRPKSIIQLGICFARSKKYLPADVIVSAMLYCYEDIRVGDETIGRGSKPESSEQLYDLFFNAQLEWEFRRPDNSIVNTHFGTILSGQKLVDDIDFKQALFALSNDAIAGEMEGVGLYSSAVSKNIPWIIVKGVSDWGDGFKHKDYQPLAAAAAASLTRLALSKKI